MEGVSYLVQLTQFVRDMNENQKSIYIQEIEYQSFVGIQALGNVVTSVNASRKATGPMSQQPPFARLIFKEIHSFLTHASNVSKLFWPIGTRRNNETDEQFEQRKPSTRRGRELREFYEIQSGHALEQRTIRDHLEHYDERLDALVQDAESDPHSGFADMLIGDDDMIAGIRPDFIMRHYNHTEGTLIFRGTRYDLTSILEALQDIHRKSRQMMA